MNLNKQSTTYKRPAKQNSMNPKFHIHLLHQDMIVQSNHIHLLHQDMIVQSNNVVTVIKPF